MSFSLIFTALLGLLVGYILQRSRIASYDIQLESLLGEDLVFVKFFLSAAATSILGVGFLIHFGIITLPTGPSILGHYIIGGVIMGVGWAMLGYTPVTAFASLGEGALDALVGIFGLFVGGWIFSLIRPFTSLSVISWLSLKSDYLPDLIGGSLTVWIFGGSAILITVCFILSKDDIL